MAEESNPQEEKIEQQPKIKMARWLQRVIGCIVPIFCFVLALQFAELVTYDYFTPWVSFGRPPGGATSFIDTQSTLGELVIFVETQTDEIYKYVHNGDEKWTLASDAEIPSWHSDCEPFDTPFTKPSGKVVDEISTTGHCFPEGMEVRWGLGWMPYQYRFAILDDGTVWGWISEPDFGQYIRFRFFFGLIGYMLGGILWFLFQYFNRTIQPPPKQKFIWRFLKRIIFLLFCFFFVGLFA